MGKLFSSGSATTTAKSKPWKPQIEPIKKGINMAGGALDTALDHVAGAGNLTADMNGTQTGALSSIATQGQSFAGGPAQQVIQAGVAGLGAGANPAANPQLTEFQKNATDLMKGANDLTAQNNAQAISGSAGALTSGNADDIYARAGQGVGGRADELYADAQAGGPNTKSNTIYGDVSANKTGQIVGDAGQFAANPYLDGQIDSVMKDIDRNFQIERGNINNAASAGGGINSTRAGTLEAYAAKDAMDRAAGISSQMRADAYTKGLDMSARAEEVRQGNTLTAGQMLQQDDKIRQDGMLEANAQGISATNAALNTQLQANSQKINTELSKLGLQLDANGQIIQAQGQNLDAALAANAQIGQGADRNEAALASAQQRQQQAANLAQQGYEMAQQANSDVLGAGDRTQQQQQAEIEGALLASGLPLNLVQQYLATVGQNFGGGTQKATTPTASPFQQIVGGGIAAAGAAGQLGFAPFGD